MYIFFCSDLITEEREARLFSNKTHNLNNKSIPFCVDIIDIPIIIMLYFLRFCIEIQYEIQSHYYSIFCCKKQNNYQFCFGIFDIYAIFEFFGFCKSVLFWENQKVYFFDVKNWKDFQKSDFSEIAGFILQNMRLIQYLVY